MNGGPSKHMATWSPGLYGWALNPASSVLRRDMQRREGCVDRETDWSGGGSSQGTLEPPEAGRGKEGLSPRALRGSVVPPTP